MNIRADRRIGLLLAGVIVLTFVAIGATIALPASDVAPTNSTIDDEVSAAGMKLFAGEGCWYCHTGYIRETSVDSPLGEPTEGYGPWSPSMLGLERIGPDLQGTDRFSREMVREHGDAHPLRYLSDDELLALTAFLVDR